MRSIDNEYKTEYDKLQNDLFWSFCELFETDKGLEFFKHKWVGYNDDNWWNNVATKDENRIAKVIGDKGTVIYLKIDFKTGIVKEIADVSC